MSNKLDLITKITQGALFAITLVMAGLFFFGGDDTPYEVGGDAMWNPLFTDALIYWVYILLALILTITLVLTLVNFVQSFRDNPKGGVKSLCVMVAFVAVFVISWFLGSGDKIDIVGYEGAHNVGFWAQFTDMCIYSIYILGAGVVLALVGSLIYSKVK